MSGAVGGVAGHHVVGVFPAGQGGDAVQPAVDVRPVGAGKAVNWPAGLGGKGNDGVAIGRVEAGRDASRAMPASPASTRPSHSGCR